MTRRVYLWPGWAFDPTCLLSLLERVGDCEPCGDPSQADVLMGWSLGAIRALVHDAEKPRVLIAGTARFCEANGWPGVPEAELRALGRLLARNPAEALRIFHGRCQWPEVNELMIETRVRASLALGSSVLKEGLEALRRLDARPALRSASFRALFLHGECDQVIPLAGAQATASLLPHAQLRVCEGGGHDLPLRHAAWCARHIRDFLGLLPDQHK